MLAYLYWPAAVVLMAWAQGLLMPAIRRTAAGDEAKRQAFALHVLLVVAYFLPLVLAPATWLTALLARLLLFDPALNLAAGDKAFAVGQTAATDRAVQWLAARVDWPPSRVRAVVWFICLCAAVWWLMR